MASVWSLFIIKIRQWHIDKTVTLSRLWQKRKIKTKTEHVLYLWGMLGHCFSLDHSH